MMFASLIMMIATDIYIPTPPIVVPPPPPPIVIQAKPVVRKPVLPKPFIRPGNPPKVVVPSTAPVLSPVLSAAKGMVGQSPPYALVPGWCWAFVEDVLKQAGSPVSPITRSGTVTDKPRAGDIVYFIIPNGPGYEDDTGHIAIIERMDAEFIYVINGNGLSRTTITWDRYPNAWIDYYVYSMHY